jgi:hypothetical protein
MTLFEYLAIAFSLVLSFAAMRLVGGLPYALERGRRYWVHVGLVGLLLFTVAIVFWAFWGYRDVVWSLPKFLVGLASPGTLYFLTATLIPENPGEVTSWREYYYSVRVRYYSALILIAVVVAFATTVLIGLPLNHPARLAQAAILVIGVVGASTADPRVHGGIVVSSLLLAGIASATVFLQPASLSE